ncbi:PqqD family protein [Candidatus Omnitrophota bacterium]
MKSKFPFKNPDIVARNDQKEALLFDPSSGNMLCINKTGTFIWELCDGTHTVEDIVEGITKKQEVDSKRAEEDCSAYLTELEKAGFIGYKD